MRVVTGRKAARVLIVLATVLLLAPAPRSAEADPTPIYIPPDATWLTSVNYYRAMAGLPAVVEDVAYSSGSKAHSCYMLLNGISHFETPGAPGYSVAGDLAARNGNVAVHSTAGMSARYFVELWMTGPFHAIGILRPGLQRVGFGKCDNPSAALYRSGATLDVLRGLGPPPVMTAPIVFPGNGTTTSLDSFQVETPNPMSFCGWPTAGGAGLPVLAFMPEAVSAPVSSSIVGPDGPLETCTLSQHNTTGDAQSLLKSSNAVISMARNKLAPGTYTVTVNTSARSVSWSFTVDPAAATGVMPIPGQPHNPGSGIVPHAVPSGVESGFLPLTPARLVDTREGLGTTTIVGQVATRIPIGGQAGIPTSPQAISANFTVTNTSGAGYLTVWNCSPERPVVASLNFGPDETVANGISVPTDASGGICVFSPVTTDLIVDVNGYYSSTATNMFSSITPTRLMDTRIHLGPSGRIASGQTVMLQVTGRAGIPTNVAAVALNVASVYPLWDGYVTVWPCDQPRPFTASLNPVAGTVRPNLVITRVAPDGTVCLFSSTNVDLVVDAMGLLSTSSTAKFEATVPFRFTDTREVGIVELNGGMDGLPVGAGQTLTIQIAGTRGVPSDAKAVSVNIAVTGASAPGFITAWQCGPRPTTANVNFEASVATSNGAQVPLSTSGQLCIYSMTDAHVIVDVNGWWA